jgi:hypothetical protein
MEKSSVTEFPRNSCLLLSAILLAASFSGCSSSPKPAPATEPITRPSAVLPDAVPDLPPPPPIREVTPTSPKAIKVISEGNEGKTQPSLIEASRMAKAKKKNEGEVRPVIEITDENLKEYSSQGQVFLVESGAEAAAAPPVAEEPEAVPGNLEPAPIVAEGRVEGSSSASADKELFWRQSVSELRTGLRRSIEDLRRIELESTLLRQQFYSESDPFVRDNEVKPRWDRALDQLAALRKKAKEDHNALNSLLAEAKKAGISPEWLQDGTSSELTEEDLRLINGPAAAKER